METQRMFELADRLKELKDAKRTAEAEVKTLNAQIDEVDYALSELMVETETQNFTRSGTMFCLTTTTRASAAEGCKDELFNTLKENGYGELVYETVNANSLSAFVKEQMEEHDNSLPSWLNGLISVYEKTTVGVRKAAR
jgi:hypothetical protein